MNDSLTNEVKKEYLCSIVHSFQKGKSPGPNGFLVELFLGFYELIKENILKVGRECQHSGKILGSMKSTFFALIPKKKTH